MNGKTFWQPAPNAQGQFSAHQSLVGSLRLNALIGSEPPSNFKLKNSFEQWQLDEVKRGEVISEKIEEKSQKLGIPSTGRKRLFSSRKLYNEVLVENPQLKPTFAPYFNE